MSAVEMARRVRLRESSARLRSADGGAGWRIVTIDGRVIGQGLYSANAWARAYRRTWPEHFQNEEESA